MTDLDQRLRDARSRAGDLAVDPHDLAAATAAVRRRRRAKAAGAGSLAALVGASGAAAVVLLGTPAGDDRLTGVASQSTAGPQAQQPRPPRATFDIRWDDPTASEGGALATPDELPDLARQALGQPVEAPDLGVPPKLIRVSGSPANMGTAALVYDFGRTDEFPDDGRVILLITPADIDAAGLDELAASFYPGMTYARFRTPTGEAILMSAEGTARVLLLKDGLKFDLTGPALDPEVARRLALRL